jgi:hypothetical protein
MGTEMKANKRQTKNVENEKTTNVILKKYCNFDALCALRSVINIRQKFSRQKNKPVTLTIQHTMSAPATALELNETQATLIINMIDIGSARGAWRGSELATIGQLHDYLKKQINAGKTVGTPNPVPVNPVPVNPARVSGPEGAIV